VEAAILQVFALIELSAGSGYTTADSPRPAWSLAHAQPLNLSNHLYDLYDLNRYGNSNNYLNVDHSVPSVASS
jgi:hypothetical protein